MCRRGVQGSRGEKRDLHALQLGGTDTGIVMTESRTQVDLLTWLVMRTGQALVHEDYLGSTAALSCPRTEVSTVEELPGFDIVHLIKVSVAGSRYHTPFPHLRHHLFPDEH